MPYSSSMECLCGSGLCQQPCGYARVLRPSVVSPCPCACCTGIIRCGEYSWVCSAAPTLPTPPPAAACAVLASQSQHSSCTLSGSFSASPAALSSYWGGVFSCGLQRFQQSGVSSLLPALCGLLVGCITRHTYGLCVPGVSGCVWHWLACSLSAGSLRRLARDTYALLSRVLSDTAGVALYQLVLWLLFCALAAFCTKSL